MTEDGNQKKAEILRLMQEGTQPEPAPAGSVNVSGNNHIVASGSAQVTVIKTEKVVHRTRPVTNPGVEHITEEQAFRIKTLVDEVVRLEKLICRPPAGYAAVWPALNRHCGATSYKLIRADRFEKAIKYLQEWTGRLRSSGSAQKKDPEWRKSLFRAIHARSRGQEARLDTLLTQKYSTSSMGELTDDALDALYRTVMRWKQV